MLLLKIFSIASVVSCVFLKCVAFAAAAESIATDGLINSFTVMTFNVGTTDSKARGKKNTYKEYGKDDAKLSDKYYGNGLAWKKAISATAEFFSVAQPDIVAFQEVFHTADCEKIPEGARREFVCESNAIAATKLKGPDFTGPQSVARLVLGVNYQIACHQGSKEKCIAVKKSFGQIRGCSADECLDFLDGQIISGCGGHSRIGRAIVDRVGGESVTVSHVYATSGLAKDDAKCRVRQFRKIFKDWGNGMPGADGQANIILGDFNTDPRRMTWIDKSARELRELIKEGGFRLISGNGEHRKPTYAGIVSLDHVVSDVFQGKCISPGITKGYAPVLLDSYFDHVPTICELH